MLDAGSFAWYGWHTGINMLWCEVIPTVGGRQDVRRADTTVVRPSCRLSILTVCAAAEAEYIQDAADGYVWQQLSQ